MKVIAALIGVFGLVLTFQNCSGQNFAGSNDESQKAQQVSSGEVAVVAGSSSEIKDSSGQTLAFRNVRNQPVGNLTIETRTSSDVVVNIYNPVTGRGSKVRVLIDASTGKFSGVERAGAHPYLCYNDAQTLCATISTNPNCSSPIFFRGALSGSVENLREPAESQYCGSVFSAADRATWIQ